MSAPAAQAPMSATSRSHTQLRAPRAGGMPAPALAVMFASGFAALGYQVVWMQQSALWLGHESAAVLALVAAFFGGLALGALLVGPRIERSAHPGRWVAGAELAVGAWALFLGKVMAPASLPLLALLGEQPAPWWQWSVAFGGTFLLLLPATAAMGATLPATERALAHLRASGASLASLYAGNTLGAMVGALGTAFWAVPTLGLRGTTWVCAAANVLCALLAWRSFDAVVPSTPETSRAGTWPARHGVLLGATGLLGIAYEVIVVRTLSQLAENTVFTFAMLLAVYLAGTAAGAAAWARRLKRAPTATDDAEQTDRLLRWLALACLAGTTTLWAMPALKAAWLNAAGPGYAAALTAEAAMAVAAFLPATWVMGALFSHLSRQALAAGMPWGRALGINTLGAAAAPALFGVGLAPAIGAKLSLLLVVAGYLGLGSPRSLRRPGTGAVAGAGLALAILAPPLVFVDIPPGGRIVMLREGALGTVSVIKDAQGVSRLHINNRQQEGSSATKWADARQALLPVLLHPSPRRALFLGVGTGVTAASAAEDDSLHVDAVELLPEVLEATRHFLPAKEDPPFARPEFIVADARRFVRATARRYDVIVADNFHPARSGSALLYTVEHFAAVRERLAPGGIFCQWLPLHQLDLETLRSIVGAFVAVHGDRSFALLATYSLETPVLGLVALPASSAASPAMARPRLAEAAPATSPSQLGIEDEFALLGTFVAGPRALLDFALPAPVNVDDRPVVAYRAPRLTYAQDSLPRDRLLDLAGQWRITPEELLGASASAEERARLSAYWRARDRFLRAGRDIRPTADPRAMLERVQQPLLDVLRTSPDFRPAYDPLLRLANALAARDPTGARQLLGELARLQPSRPEAATALAKLPDARAPDARPSADNAGAPFRR